MQNDKIRDFELEGIKEKYKVSVWSWIFTMIMLLIPIINIIYIIVLLFGGGKQAKVSMVRAMLLVTLIGIVIWFVVISYTFGDLGMYFEELINIINTFIENLKSRL